MKRILVGFIVAAALWVGASAVFRLPPLYHYVGDSGDACINHLRQIDGAKQQWAIEKGKTNGSPVTAADIAAYVKKDAFQCPSGGTYVVGAIGEDPTCSYGTKEPPPGLKERVGLLGWRWKIWPSSSVSHRMPK